MAMIVAEYLGQRTDASEKITPHREPFKEPFPQCPFNNLPCAKMAKKTDAKHPVCSLKRGRDIWIICEHRLISTSFDKATGLSEYQKHMLHSLARKVLSPTVAREQVIFKAEVRMASRHKADFILGVTPDVAEVIRFRKMLVEIQGGGETSNTGTMTRHVGSWTQQPSTSNSQLRTPLGEVGPIQTNAWRRLQEQILAKGSVAIASGSGFAACVSPLLYDQVRSNLNNFTNCQVEEGEDWDMLILAYVEDQSTEPQPGPIPLTIDPNRTLYTSFELFVKAIGSRGVSDDQAFNNGFLPLQ
jgi:hypothetical protein